MIIKCIKSAFEESFHRVKPIASCVVWMMLASSALQAQRSFTLGHSPVPIQLEDAAWNIQPPVALEGAPNSAQRCTFRLRSDDHALCVYLEVWQPHENHEFNVSAVEVWFSPQMGATQKRYRLKVEMAKLEQSAFVSVGKEAEQPYEGLWELKSHLTFSRSQYLIRIPFGSLGLKTPDHGDVWGFNVVSRLGVTNLNDVGAAWVLPTEAEPEALGTIAFE